MKPYISLSATLFEIRSGTASTDDKIAEGLIDNYAEGRAIELLTWMNTFNPEKVLSHEELYKEFLTQKSKNDE